MKRGHYLDTFEILKLAPETRNPLPGVEQVFHSGISHDNDYVGLHRSDFPQ